MSANRMDMTEFKINAVSRWTKNMDFFELHLIFIPVHLNKDWTLAVIHFKDRKLVHYDSFVLNVE